MRMIGRPMLALVAGGVLAGCSTMEKGAVVSPESVEGKTWVLSSLNGEAPVNGSRVTLEFKPSDDREGRVSGRAPCNGYFGHYKVKGSRLEFGRMGSTMMACKEPVMKQEMAYLSSFQKVENLMLEGDKLVLRSPSGTEMLTFMSETAHLKGSVQSSTGFFPGNSDVRVQIRDLSNKDVRSNLIGEQKVKLRYELDAPLQFDVPYAPHLVKPGHTYSVSVKVRQKGKLVSSSTVENIVDLHKSLSMKTTAAQ